MEREWRDRSEIGKEIVSILYVIKCKQFYLLNRSSLCFIRFPRNMLDKTFLTCSVIRMGGFLCKASLGSTENWKTVKQAYFLKNLKANA